MATEPIETHLHRTSNWENAAPPGGPLGPRGRSDNCRNGLLVQCDRLRSEINRCLAIVYDFQPDKCYRNSFPLYFGVSRVEREVIL